MIFEPTNKKSLSLPAPVQQGRKLILSVDDELGVLYSRYKPLSAAGYAVVSATDGIQALQIVSSDPIDFVLPDFILEGMNGGKVADMMKAIRPDIQSARSGVYRTCTVPIDRTELRRTKQHRRIL